jgi:16S rRNA G527 N7-methylase RsmG
MLRPDLDVVLIEPNSKKAAFLPEIIGELDIGHASLLHGGMEEVPAG